MKIQLKKTVCIILALFILLPLASCSKADQSKPIMTFHGKTLSTNMFSYMLTSQEIYTLAFGNIYLPYAYQNSTDYQSLGSYDTFQYYVQNYSALSEALYTEFVDSFGTMITDNDGTTISLGNLYFDALLIYLKRLFIISVLCEEYGLELTDTAVLEDISTQIQEYIDTAGNEAFLDIYLYDKYGASLDIAREYAEKYNLLSMLVSEGGGSDSVHWDSEYKYLNYLLYDYLYGENGARQITDEEVESIFKENYCIFDYVFYSAYKTVDSETVLRLDDFITDDIHNLFESNYNKVSYISLDLEDDEGNDISETAESTANEICDKLNAGEIEWDSADETYTQIYTGTYCFAPEDSKIDDAVENAVKTLSPGAYTVVTGIDSVYVLRGETLAEEDLAGVKNEIITILSKRYYDVNYSKMNYIFLSYTDGNGDEYSEDKKAEIHALGTEIFQKLYTGLCSYNQDDDAFIENDYEDADYTVKLYTDVFGKNELDEELEEKLLSMSIGSEAVYEDEYGFYILNRIEKDDDEFADSAVQLNMTMDYLRKIAEDFEEKFKSGEILFEDAEEHNSYAQYSELGYLDYSLYGEQIKTTYNLNELGDGNISVSDTAVNIIHIRGTDDDDYITYKDEINEEMNYNAFCEYIDAFFDDIVIDEKELALYKASFTGLNYLIIPSLDTVDESSS
ncbi:MAG: hypothetical protein PHW77_07545 [Eubacteriales bacterium]|nr:hypothetical protein [Eubacteriales bacterium]